MDPLFSLKRLKSCIIPVKSTFFVDVKESLILIDEQTNQASLKDRQTTDKKAAILSIGIIEDF